VAEFELSGTAEDETRILSDRVSGYSVALVGHPSLAPAPEGLPRYDVIVKLADVKAEHGFRIDEVPSSMPSQALAVAFATAYANTRAEKAPQVLAVAPKYLPTGADGGATAQYRRRDASASSIEQIWVATKPSPSGVWALYHTTRCDLDEVNTIKWLHLRSTSMGQHRWSESEVPRTAIWPASEMATPTAKLELTEPEWAEAAAKARDLPELSEAVRADLVPFFTSVARTDDPPALELIEKMLEIRWGQLSMKVEPAAAQVFLRNMRRCRTALDLRAWAWQCVWAIGNRESVGN
jgi:hypothetical protein